MILNFLLSPSYQGATLLGVLLHNHSRISCLAATFPARDAGQVCSCGEPVERCGFWKTVSERVDANRFADGPVLLPLVPRLLKDPGRNRVLNGLMWRASRVLGAGVWGLFPGARDEYLDAHGKFLETVLELQGTDTIVVGLNEIFHVLALKSMLGRRASVKAIHLLRDPRGFVYSCRKYTDWSLEEAAKRWRETHEAIEKMRKSPTRAELLAVRYEDLCRDPEGAMDRVFAFLGTDGEDVVRAPERGPHFHLTGNRMLQSFNGTIEANRDWETVLTQEEQGRILSLTEPVASRHGYRPER